MTMGTIKLSKWEVQVNFNLLWGYWVVGISVDNFGERDENDDGSYLFRRLTVPGR